ncbi:MAG TPA: site-specific integrase [Kofleriaceae bacterium]|jgi:integrase
MASDEGIKQLTKTTWLVRVKRVEKKTGLERNRKRTVTGTKADARAARDELRDELASTQTSRPRTRLREYAASWLERRAADLKPSVIRKYGYGIQAFDAQLGDLYLDSISSADVTAYVQERAKTKSGNTVLNELRLLRTISRDTVNDGYAAKHWADRVKPPKVKGYTREWLNLLNREQLAKITLAIPQQWRGLVMFIVTTGLRWGEASALHWEDVDLKAGEAVIHRGNDRGQLVAVKTKGSNRVVPVLPEVASMWGLKRSRGLVFPTKAGKLHRGTPLRKVLEVARLKAGVPRVTTHGLRRTFNNLARQSTSREVLKSITGHTTDAMVEHYSHVGTEEKAVVSRSVAEAAGVLPVSSDQDDE